MESVHPIKAPFTLTLPGNQTKSLALIPTKGKYLLEETKTICKIMRSIEPVDLMSECMKLNKLAGFSIAICTKDQNNPRRMVCFINTVYGSIAFDAYLNEDVPVQNDNELPAPITKEEFDLLKQIALQ